jgi:cell surface protein SprA
VNVSCYPEVKLHRDFAVQLNWKTLTRNQRKRLTLVVCHCLAWFALTFPFVANAQDSLRNVRDTSAVYQPTKRPTYRPTDRYGDPFSNTTTASPLFLKDPNKLKLDVEIDTSLNYTVYEKIGDLNYRPTTSMSFEEFKQYQDRKILKEYWQTRSRAMDGESAVSGRGFTPKIFVSPILDRIFGGSYVELIPRGFVTLDFGGSFQKIANPNTPIRQQRNGSFEFDQQINMSVVGKVGEKLAVTANFDNNNSFDFQNNMKVEYTGFKEDILQKLEIGNVSLPLNNTLIQGAQNLFGIKAQMQFGRMNVTTIASTQRGKVSSIDIPGGQNGQGRPFQIVASQYDDNRHFFLSHFFRDNYRKWIQNLPQITSGINITRVEVYLVNRTTDTQTLRNIIGFMDMGESNQAYNPALRTGAGPTSNKIDVNGQQPWKSLLDIEGTQRLVSNAEAAIQGLFPTMENGVDFEKITGARKLAPTEFSFHTQLGYITLTRKLQNDEALAVAYEYTHKGVTYKVGELTDDYGELTSDDAIFLKLLRHRNLATYLRTPAWDLMMKNIYSLNVTELSQENFQLRIIYRDDASGLDNPQLQVSNASIRDKQLIEIFGLDKLNPVNDPQHDGNFDYVEGITINSENGLIIFPYLEPFNEALREVFKLEQNINIRDQLIQKYVYDTLYRTTKADAELFATKNKFWLKGVYNAGSAKEIVIPGFGVSPGSVKIFAGGIPLQEGTDYTVDYTFGKVLILNESILSSGKNISVQYEQSDPFAFQTRSLIGTRFDYKLNDDVNFGSTFLYYNERPLISRNQIGTEPARNMQYGLDFNIRKDSRLLTKMVDALPIIQTKEQSSFNISAEFAQLFPGTSNIIDGEGTAYIDDFENSATPYSLMSPQSWKIAATPKGDTRFDPSNGGVNDISAGYRRAKLAWYQIDNQFYRNDSRFKPENITDKDLQNHYVRGVAPNEIFPYRQLQQAVFWESIFDVAYYPNERGPYNYRTDLTPDGTLPGDAKQYWGGITTPVRTEVDFDKANIEYVEFWLLDPFIEGENGKVITRGKTEGVNNTTGGQIIFQLGNISEDVTRDGKHFFENGLPPEGNLTTGADETPWGFAPNQNYLTNAFDNSASSREVQDVGLDGLPSDGEAAKFSDFLNLLTGDARAAVSNDPSADDFRYFLNSEYDDAGAQLLERYKDFNGLDGNSPIIGNDVVARSGSQSPDNEDLNADNTLNELEEYYEYAIDLKENLLDVGKPYIVDKITTTPPNVPGESVTWYLYRIPIRDVTKKVGDISGFKSIRYMRMILTGFEQPVVLRMANFRMVGSRWRKYQGDLRTGFDVHQEPYDDFNLSVMNLEENGFFEAGSTTSVYTIPPGVVRDRDNTSSVSRQLNEQSIQVCVDELKDGDARAIYKNAAVDLFNYGRIKMFFHANSETAKDGDLTAFLRLGSDFDQNYYEIEIPLVISNPSSQDQRDVWPVENEIDLDLNRLMAMKLRRDGDAAASLSAVYTFEQTDKHALRILGRPDLSSVQVLMIGIRNPRVGDDNRAHSVCVWANELRVTDFNRTAGWAVSTTMSTKLADFATVTGALRYTTFGFGSVSSKIGERTRDETTSYDVSANVNADKFIPGNTGIKVPMFVSYENTTINPQYDPANPDTRIDAALQSLNSEAERRSFKKLIQDRTTRRSLNFVNVRKTKVKPDARTHIYDIENLSFSYSFSEASQTNFFMAENLLRQYNGSVAYNFAPKETGIEPFKNSKGLKSPYLKFIKDFNFSLLPSSISVRGDLDRRFEKKVYRISTGVYGEYKDSPQANYQKNFMFRRNYNVRWAFSKSLTLDYTSNVDAVIDEPYGDVDDKQDRDSIIYNLKNGGRMKLFNQSVTVNYTLPLDKFPVTDWLGAEYRYQASYRWIAGPLNVSTDADAAVGGEDDLPDMLDFKNTLENSRENNITGKIDLVKLYNKIKFLKELNTPPRPQPTTKPQTGRAVSTRPQAKVDTVKQTPAFIKSFFRALMSIRSINATYTRTEGTILPGFVRTPKFMGMDSDWDAPGWKFVLGSQNPGIRHRAAHNGWLTELPDLSTPFSQIRNEDISIRANVEPSSDFKIQLDVKKETSDSYSTLFQVEKNLEYDPNDPTKGPERILRDLSPSRSGSYRISFNTIRTAFNNTNDNIHSDVFKKFQTNLSQVRDRLTAVAQANGASNEYSNTAQDVLIPAFISAYSGKDVNTVSLSPFPNIPLPNWRIDYSGLNKLEAFKSLFQSITISHGYQASYSVMNYTNTTELGPELHDEVALNRKIYDYNKTFFGGMSADGDYVPVYVIPQVMISEQFAPLIGVNVRTKGRLTARAEYKTKRDIALNISNAQVTEQNNKDVSMELGYTKNNMKLPFKSQGRTIVLKNDVTFRMNVTVNNTKTIQREINDIARITAGNVNYQIRPNVSYVVNQKLTLQGYFEKNINEPVISTSYRQARSKFGIQVRFSLAQ